MSVDPTVARSFLFVPGDRPDRFAKAVASGADSVIIDLEDAVAGEAKEVALQNAVAWLAGGSEAIVRINAAGTRSHRGELAALADCVVMLPKAESADAVNEVCERVGASARVIALVETARGVRNIDEVAAVPGVIRVALGNVDLGTELGVDPASHAALAYARGCLVTASAAAGLPAPVDGVTARVHAEAELQEDIAHGRELGFGAKLCIHPSQVAAVNRSFSPTREELAWAHRVLAHPGGVALVDGAMVDEPVVRRAAQLVALAERLGD
jgi:citrate lyase subunit beta/citryl-CoA lyase